jgi:hypothetical protein
MSSIVYIKPLEKEKQEKEKRMSPLQLSLTGGMSGSYSPVMFLE